MIAGRVLVVGLGNPDRGDDGIGPRVVRGLRAAGRPGIEMRERAGDVLALIDDWQGYAAVVLVDAAESLGAPGKVHRVDLRREAVPSDLAPHSTHGFGLAEAVRLAEKLGRLPPALILYAVEAEGFVAGAPLSDRVAAAETELAGAVLREAEALLASLLPVP